MGLKKRNKVSAEFSMSSLTDIIFLLLIFFMLTSTLVQIQNVDLPESDAKTVAASTMIVTLNKDGNIQLNSKDVSSRRLERSLRKELSKLEDKKNATVTIAAEKGVAFERVSTVMEMAAKMRMKAILATTPKTN